MIEGWGAALVGAAVVGSVASAAISAGGAESAAQTQAGAAENAQQISENEFNTITGQEQPFMNAGYGALSQLNYLTGSGKPGSGTTASSSTAGGYGSLLQPFTQQQFQQYSPAYQFQLQQGQQGVLNADSSSQGALSGAAQKDLIGYNQGLANTSFNNAFNQYQTQQGNIYSRLSGIASMGQNAAANTGQQGTALAGSAAQSATNVGTALGAGTIGASNALAGGVSNLGSLYAAYGGGGSGGGNPGNLGGSTPTAGAGQTLQYDASGNITGSVGGGGDVGYINSDWFLKTHIEPYLFYGMIPLYKFRYKGEPENSRKHIGVIAQEVMRERPDVVKRGKDGYLKVNYRKLGIPTDEDWQALEAMGACLA